ncbi:hypothetical protein ABZP36_008876 [Zizania latifolia]
MDMVSESPIGLDFELLSPTSVKIELIHKLVASVSIVGIRIRIHRHIGEGFNSEFSFKFSKRSLREFAVDVFSLGTKAEKP